jgi:putative nucleotidyltransferase with HDIG domain
MIKLKDLINELEYPLAKEKEMQSFQGVEGRTGKLVWMSPQKFLGFVPSLPDYAMDEKSYWNLKNRMQKGLPIDFLNLKIDHKRRKIVGHEGRHRATVAKELGIKQVPVLLYFDDWAYPHVPKWDKSHHDFADKLDFKPEWDISELLDQPIEGGKFIAYHGTDIKFRKFSLKKSTQGIIWLTSNKEKIKSREVGASGKGYIVTAEVTINNPAGWSEYDKLGLGELQRDGFDGAVLKDSDNEFTCFVFNPSQIKILKVEPMDYLNEGVQLDFINQQIFDLEAEWEQLDSQGTGYARQSEISRELQKLEMEKQKWSKLHKAADGLNESNEISYKFPMLAYHGGKMEHKKPVLFLTRHLNVANSYSGERGSGKIHKFMVDLKNPARNDVINRLARQLNIEGSIDDYSSDEQSSPTYEYLSPEMVGYDAVKSMIKGLTKMGYDGAWIDGDFAMNDSFTEYDSIVVWNSSTITPIKESKDSKDSLSENEEDEGPDVLLGEITQDHDVMAVKGYSDSSKHPAEWNRHKRWRYVPELGMLGWWEPPDDTEKMMVKDYLTKKGYPVKIHYTYGYVREEKNEEKELVMEKNVSAQDLESFIREMIKGSEWEGKVFAVGGFVRDEVMGKNPKDLDVVVNKHQGGIEFTTWLARKLGIYKQSSNPVTFPSFGTANLRLDGVVRNGIDYTGEEIDAVMPRAEQYHDKSTRKPSAVQFTSLADDAKRRDLTINAIYKNISTGEIFDPVNGVEDIKNKHIRTLVNPDLIYTDDALRMFRAVRFATQLGFELDPDIVSGIKRNLHRLSNTSKERMRDELNKILKTNNPDRGIKLLRDTGLLPYLAKELQGAVGMTQNVHHKDDVFDHTMEVLKKTKPELIQRLTALFHDIGKVVTRSETPTGVHFYGHEDAGADIVERIMRDLKYPTELINAVKLGVKNHMRLKSGGDTAVKLSDKALRKFKIEMGEHLENLLDVMHADNIAHASASAMPNQIENVRKRLDNLEITVDKPNLPINGFDLKRLGLKPGPLFSEIMSAVTDAWYENPNIGKEEAIQIAKQVAGI